MLVNSQGSSQGSIGELSSYSQSGAFISSVRLGTGGRSTFSEALELKNLLCSEVLLGDPEAQVKFINRYEIMYDYLEPLLQLHVGGSAELNPRPGVKLWTRI